MFSVYSLNRYFLITYRFYPALIFKCLIFVLNYYLDFKSTSFTLKFHLSGIAFIAQHVYNRPAHILVWLGLLLDIVTLSYSYFTFYLYFLRLEDIESYFYKQIRILALFLRFSVVHL